MGKLSKIRVSPSEASSFLHNTIKDERIASNKIKKVNGHDDYESICEYIGRRVLQASR